jgi:hypothetical protein
MLETFNPKELGDPWSLFLDSKTVVLGCCYYYLLDSLWLIPRIVVLVYTILTYLADGFLPVTVLGSIYSYLSQIYINCIPYCKSSPKLNLVYNLTSWNSSSTYVPLSFLLTWRSPAFVLSWVSTSFMPYLLPQHSMQVIS